MLCGFNVEIYIVIKVNSCLNNNTIGLFSDLRKTSHNYNGEVVGYVKYLIPCNFTT